jgi:hypothetical protein
MRETTMKNGIASVLNITRMKSASALKENDKLRDDYWRLYFQAKILSMTSLNS